MARPLRWPRRVRILLAAASFAVHLGALGFAGAFGARVLGWNLGPELLAARAGVLAAAVLVPLGLELLLTLVAGRVYCAAFCPLGILQDLLGVVFRRRGRAPTATLRGVHFGLFLAALIGLGIGYVTAFRLLDPYTVFGSIASATFSPALFHLQNLILPNDTLTVPPYTALVAVTGLVPLVLLAALVAFRRRCFCAVLCPVGFLLGQLSRRAPVRIGLKDAAACVGCGACARRCPAGAIDPATREVDNARCIRCLDCLAACPARALGVVVGLPHPQPKPAAPAAGTDAASRRRFLVGSTAALGGLTVAAGLDAARIPVGGKAVICPPGAGSADEFFRRCTGCQACVVNCPGTVIRPAGWLHPTVRLVYDTGLCEFNCRRCMEVCPTGALRMLALEEKQRTRIGRAEFHPERCVAVQEHHDCGACAEHCPTGALQMVADTHGVPVPHFTPELCIGCGSCEHPCPVRPEKAIIVRPVPVQERATAPAEYFKAHPPKVDAPQSEGGDWLV